ncbi:MAG: HlyD family efflux transporter periplasmic adaptor subunit [Bacteroidaceae bacterium]|nr:HlyD family efflux transporter periplasmic adaptor subunit [Prevotellaceae bacterium]MDY5760544.1 HlyD family efflux transporter periplasmic adaptor subunit [Bacteroidaceae bacterium]
MDRAIPVGVQRKRRMVRYGKYAAIVAVVMGVAVWLGTLMMSSVDKKSLITSQVDRGTIDVSIIATGKVVPAFEEVIISPISAQILEVYAHSGDTVDVGTPLLRLDLQSAQTDYSKALDEQEIRRQQMVQLTTNTETQLSDRRMQLEVEEMKIGQLEAQLRNEQYLDSLGSGTKDRVHQAEITLRTAQMQLKQLKQQYENEVRVRKADLRMKQLQDGIADKSLEETRRTLDGANIRSPRKATLTYISNEIGSIVGSGSKVAVISDLTHFKVDCSIADTYSDRVMAGGRVLVKIGKERLFGTINTVTPLSQDGVITFTVLMDNPSHPKLRSGLKAEVFVITSIKEDVLRIRNGSYYTGAGNYTLFIYKDEHTLVPRTIQLGDCNYDYVEVISGLEEGDSVVVSDMQRYKGKEKIRVNE